MPNALTAWPDERTERLKTLWAEGSKSATIIGAELGVSRNAVLGKVHRLGLESHFVASTKKQKPRVVYVRPLNLASSKGFRGEEVAKPTRITRTRYHEGMKTVSISETNRILSEPTKNQLRAMLAEAVRNTAAMG